MEVGLPLQSYQAYSTRENAQSLVNCFAVKDVAGGKTQLAIYPDPGLKNFIDFSGSTVLAGIRVNGLAYFVYLTISVTPHATLATVDTFGNITVLGDLGTNISDATMASVGTSATDNIQILIATGQTGYLYNISTSSLTTVGSSFPTGCTFVAAMNGYFIALTPGAAQWFVSALEDGTTWSALMVASTETSFSNLVGATSLFQQLFLFSEETTEIWFSTAAQQFPFLPTQGNYFNYGCAAPKSIATCNNCLIWLGRNVNGQGIVLQGTSGNTVNPISTDALTYAFAQYTTISDARAFVYQKNGHEFYQITFPTAGKTWCYDLMTGMWHEKQSFNVNATVIPSYTRHRGNCCVFLNGIHLVGDYTSGKLFVLDNNTTTDDTSYPLPRVTITPDLTFDDRYVTIYSLELFVEPGQGLNSGQGSAPLIGLEISRDGGFTWGNQRLRSMGLIGQYNRRVRWNLLGHARNWVFRFTMTDPIKFIVLGMVADVDVAPQYPPTNYMQKIAKDM